MGMRYRLFLFLFLFSSLYPNAFPQLYQGVKDNLMLFTWKKSLSVS